jgi:hypothetical protein
MDGTRLSNGILLNGVWKDYYDIIVAANEKEKRMDEVFHFLSEDRDSLARERCTLLTNFRCSISSLTSVETNHLKAQQIIDHIRIEKEELIIRCQSLEAQRDWLDKQRLEHFRNQNSMEEVINLLELKIKEGESRHCIDKDEINCLLDLTYNRDEKIDALERKGTRQDQELAVLGKSLTTKDKQFQTLLKERDRLKDELERFRKELLKNKRFHYDTKVTFDEKYSSPNNLKNLLRQERFVKSPLSPEDSDDTDEMHTTNESDFLMSPSSINSTEKKLSSNKVQSSIMEEGLDLTSLLISECGPSNLEVKDKVYRSVIRKLQKELSSVRSSTLKSHPSNDQNRKSSNDKTDDKRTQNNFYR